MESKGTTGRLCINRGTYAIALVFLSFTAFFANLVAFMEHRWQRDMPVLESGSTFASALSVLLLCAIVFIWERRRRRSMALLEAECDKYRHLVDIGENLVMEVDVSGRVCLTNEYIQNVLKYEKREMSGTPVWDLFPSEDAERARRVFEHILDGSWSSDVCIELPTRTMDGRERTVAWHIRPLQDQWGGVHGALCTGKDITDFRSAEETAKKLTRVVEQSPCIIMIIDDDGYIEYVNPKFSRVTGLAPNDVVGMLASELGHQLHLDEPHMWEELKNGREWRGDFINRKKGGDLVYERASISPVRMSDTGKVKFIKVSEDVTERRVAEDHLKRLAHIVEQAAEGIVVTDLNRTVTFANNAWAHMHGYKSPDEIIGGPLSLFHTEEQIETQVNPLYEALTISDSKSGEVWHRHRDGYVFPTFMITTRLTDCANYPIGAVGFAVDIAERKSMEEQLRQHVYYDSLTSLPNRAMFLDRLRTMFGQSQRKDGSCFALLFIDLDHFKKINDSYGHLFGDRVLVLISQRLLNCTRPFDMVSRLGGDDFVIILDGFCDEADVLGVAERIHEEVQRPLSINDTEVFMTTSIGIAFYNMAYKQPEEFLRDADTAMYQAKSLGRARSVVFEQSMHSKALEAIRLQNDLHRALERNEFVLYYQPIINVSSWSITGFEALIRWQHPALNMLGPMRFIPLAEETGLIIPLGDWVLREACRQVAQWREMFPSCPGLMVTVNISAKQFNMDLPEHIGMVLAESGIGPESLRLEITENMIMSDAELSLAVLDRLHAMGVKVYLDDFGTGYSSLNYIHKFPVDALKIDRSFVKNIRTDKEAEEIVKAIVSLGHSLGKRIIVEGIEDHNQLQHFRELNCVYVQGMLFSKPLDAGCAESFIRLFIDGTLTEEGFIESQTN